MTNRSSGIDVESAQGPDAASTAVEEEEEERNATTTTALAVAAMAAVDLTNLFFLLRGRSAAGVTAIEELAVLFAFAAFLMPAGGLMLIENAACGRVLLVASAASLFVASAGTALSLLLRAQCLARFGPAFAN
ncbi:hypothetical protein ACP70R_029656 [Stipagrostis hirtigluma subsp. patula]